MNIDIRKLHGVFKGMSIVLEEIIRPWAEEAADPMLLNQTDKVFREISETVRMLEERQNA